MIAARVTHARFAVSCSHEDGASWTVRDSQGDVEDRTDALSAGNYAVIDLQRKYAICGWRWAIDLLAVSVFGIPPSECPDTLGAHRHGRRGDPQLGRKGATEKKRGVR